MAMIEPNEETILRLTAYLDGEMSDEERAQLEADAARDPDLAELLAEATDAMGVVSGLPDVQAPEDFELAVERRIRRRSQGRFYARQQIQQRDSSFLFVLIALGILIAWTIISRPGNLELLLNADGVERAQPDSPPEPESDPESDTQTDGSGESEQTDETTGALPTPEPPPFRPGAPLEALHAAPAQTANPQRTMVQWTLTLREDLALDSDAAEQALMERVGRSNLRSVGDGEWAVTNANGDPAAWLQALDELGQVSRVSIPAADTRDNPPLRVIASGDR
jgi:hypothetical protein